MAKDIGWKAALGAAGAYFLSAPIAFGALTAMVVAAFATYCLDELRRGSHDQ